jgi:quinol-cytochrome oxidoreductase complex cytochrome b subunit
MSGDLNQEKIYSWLDQRLGLSSLIEMGAKKKVPIHKHSIWYYMGGIAIALLLVQILTGVLLMFYYVPEIGSAHSSVLFINSQVDFGWFIRSLHSWGANLMIFVLFLHMFSTYFMKAYRKPREITWITGLILLVLALGFGFTGYLLPWDEISFFATKIGIDITAQLPFIGELIATLLRGGESVGQATISRFFTIHVIVLPLALFSVLGLHLLLIQLHGMSEPKEFSELPEDKKTYESFFPTFALKDFMVWLLTINFLSVIVMLFPWGVGSEADPFAPAPAGIKPEWYFLAMFQVLKEIPSKILIFEGEHLGLLAFGLIGFIFLIAPFVDRGKNLLVSKIFTFYGITVLLALVFYTIKGLF